MKKNKGITLIALIITIIVMLILVAVTVTIANDGESGLFVKARKAKVDTAYEAEKENLLMYMYGEDYNAVTGELNLASVKTKLEKDTGRWQSVNINSEGTRLEVEGIQSGKAHTVSVNGTVDGEKTPDTPEPEQSIYEGKVWGKGLTTEKLKELGFSEEEITAGTTKKVYFRSVDDRYYEQVSGANTLEEVNQILDGIGSTLSDSEKDRVGSWIDSTEEIKIDDEATKTAKTIGVKEKKLMVSYNAEAIFYVDIARENENRITLTITTENQEDDGTVTKTGYDNWPVFIEDNGNSIYFIMFGH